MESEKDIKVTISRNLKHIPTYDLFLVKKTTEYIEIQLATKMETENSIEVSIDNIFRIGKDEMLPFAYEIVKSIGEPTHLNDETTTCSSE